MMLAPDGKNRRYADARSPIGVGIDPDCDYDVDHDDEPGTNG